MVSGSVNSTSKAILDIITRGPTYIILGKLWEDLEKLLEEGHEMVGNLTDETHRR